MEDENEGDIEEDFVANNDYGTENEDFYTVEEISSDFSRVLKRTVSEQIGINDTVALSLYDSDVNLVIDGKTFSAACPVHGGGFCFLQAGVRATHGFAVGSVCFEVKFGSLCNIQHIDGHLNSHIIRVGWSTYGSSLALGSDCKSYGYDSNGKASNNGQNKDYGKTWTVDDVIGVYLDYSETIVSISFTVNGEDQGIAYKVSRFELNNEALFPHVLSKNIAFECNFRSESSWFPPKKGYSFVGDMPLNKRIPGPRAPKRQADCEVIIMVGLPRSGKTTWTREFCAKNPGKYYVLDTLHLVDKMELMDSYRNTIFHEKTHVLRKLLKIALTHCRNYILDQINSRPVEWFWKLKMFKFFGHRRAVVCSIPDDEFERRLKMQPLEKGPDYLKIMKGKFTLPKPSYLLNKVEYVGLSQMEAENLFKRYFEEYMEQGYVPQKKVNHGLPDWKAFLLGQGPTPKYNQRQKAPNWKNTTHLEKARKKSQKMGGAIAFVAGGIFNESSVITSRGESTMRNVNFRESTGTDLSRRVQSPPARNIIERPPVQQSIHPRSSISPSRNIDSGIGIPRDGIGSEGMGQQDCGPLQSEGQVGWKPLIRSSNFPPLRGGVAQGWLANESLEQGRHMGSMQMPERKVLGSAGIQQGRLELGLQTQNSSADSSPNRRGLELEEFHHQRSISGPFSSQNLRQGELSFPLTREQMARDYALRQQRAIDFPPHDSRDSDGGLLYTDGQMGGKFPPPQRRVFNHRSAPREIEGGGLNLPEGMRGRFPEILESRDETLRYREDLSEFPSEDRRQREQMRSRGQGREINQQRMSLEEIEDVPRPGRGDSFPYHDRMENEIIQNSMRTSSNVLPILGKRMRLGSGERPIDDIHSNVSEILFQEERFLGDRSQRLSKNEGRDCARSDHLARDSRGVGMTVGHESTLGSDLQHLKSCQEVRSRGGRLSSKVGVCGNKELLKSGSSDWNQGPAPVREYPFQNMREGNTTQPSSAQRTHSSLTSVQWKSPNSGLDDHSPGTSQWGSRSPEHTERLVSENDHRGPPGLVCREFPRSRSPVGGCRPPDHSRLCPGGSPVSGPILSLDHDSRRAPVQFGPGDLSGRSLRTSSEWGGRHSPCGDVRRSPGHGGCRGEDSPNWLRRGSPIQFSRASPDQVRRESLTEFRDRSPYQFSRSSPDQSRRGFLDKGRAEFSEQFHRGSPDEFRGETSQQLRRESPDQRREEHFDQLRSKLIDQFGRESPGNLREESPGKFRRESPYRFRGESPVRFREESPDRSRGEPPNRFRRESPDRFRGESPDRFRGEPPNRFRGESPNRFRGESPNRFRGEPPDRFREQSHDQSLNRFVEQYPNQLGRDCTEYFERESHSQIRRQSPDQFMRKISDRFRRETPDRIREEHPDQFRKESLDQFRGGTLDWFREEHPDQLKGECIDQLGRDSAHRFRSGSPDQFRKGHPRGSPIRGSRGSPGPGRRGSPGPGRRGSPGPGRRGSPGPPRRGSPGPQRRGSPGPRRRGSSGPQRRGSPGPHRRESLGPERRGSPGPLERASPIEHFRGSPNRDSKGSRILEARGSHIRRSRSPVSGQSSSFGRVRRCSSDQNLRTPPHRNSRGSSILQSNSPSVTSMTRSARHSPEDEMSQFRRTPWHSPSGRSGNKRPRGRGMNRFNCRELSDSPSHLSRADSRDHLPLDGEDDVKSSYSGERNNFKNLRMNRLSESPSECSEDDALASYEEDLDELLGVEKPRYSGAARKRLKWLLRHGHTVREARLLALAPIPKWKRRYRRTRF